MKKLLSILMCVSLLSFSFYSCSSDDDNGGDTTKRPSINITVKSYYEKDGQKLPDAGSTVYILEGFGYNAGGKWEYKGNGNFHSNEWGTNWGATKTAIIGVDGSIRINNIKSEQGDIDKYNYFTIVVESKYYKDINQPVHAKDVYLIQDKNLIITTNHGSISMDYEK